MKFGNDPTAVEVNVADRETLFRRVRDRFASGEGFALATINLDHLTKLPVDESFLSAYQAHELVVADGNPIVWLSRLARKPVQLLPGSELILPLCETCAEADVPVALVGSSDEALAGASDALKARVPGLKVAYSHAPPYGFDPAGETADAIHRDVAASGARMCFIALGAPKQEVFAARGRSIAPAVGYASIGAGLDFLSGHQVRAPKLARMFAMEWLWRALSSPRRMVPRYAKCFAILPGLTVQALRQR